jgi:type IV pilus assembly protein PilX
MSRAVPLQQRVLQRESGVILIVVLVMLLAVMILGVSAFLTTSLGERIAGNSRDRQVAFQAAESALRDAEVMMGEDTDGPFQPLRVNQFSAACTNGYCRSSTAAPIWSGLSEADWVSSKTWAYGAASGAAAIANVASQPRYVIEYQETVQPIEPGKPCIALFLITARAAGIGSTTNVMLQSVFRMRVGECYAAI